MMAGRSNRLAVRDRPVARILVGAIGTLGNTLLAGPMVRTLQARFPGAEIRFAFKTERGGQQVAPHLGCPGRHYLFSACHGKLRAAREVCAAIAWRPDILIVPFLTGGKAMQLVAAATPSCTLRYHEDARFRYRSRDQRAIPADPGAHEVELYLALLSGLRGAQDATAQPGACFSVLAQDTAAARRAWLAAGLQGRAPLVAINPFSSSGQAWKRWDPARWEHLLVLLEAAGLQPVLLVSAQERAQIDGWPAMRRFPCFSERLGVSAAMLALCQLAVSCDTGFAHLTAACGVPALVLFGPTDERRARPWGAHHRILFEDVACRPCYGLGKPEIAGDCTHRSCLQVAPEAVAAAAMQMLTNHGAGTRVVPLVLVSREEPSL